MRCIEISLLQLPALYLLGLTLTWDVLKSQKDLGGGLKQWGLTLTWDVLKCRKQQSSRWILSRLTLTWDVLK